MSRTIEAIHKRFDIAGERLLAQAKRIINNTAEVSTAKAERLKSIGFGATKPIREMEERVKAKGNAQETVEAIEYYRLYYPSYKFISKSQIESICKKYGLLYGDSKNYIGDIPEKNLSEIEAFKLREEDFYQEPKSVFENWLTPRLSSEFWWYERTLDAVSTDGLTPAVTNNDASMALAMALLAEEKIKEKKKPAFKICAPKKEFNTQGYEVVDGYKLVYDPIVIQPVKFKNLEGGLIVSKWGLPDEANKELFNESSN